MLPFDLFLIFGSKETETLYIISSPDNLYYRGLKFSRFHLPTNRPRTWLIGVSRVKYLNPRLRPGMSENSLISLQSYEFG
jgi:hypothetical protein